MKFMYHKVRKENAESVQVLTSWKPSSGSCSVEKWLQELSIQKRSHVILDV
jgi:hypothetical protein